ncbi:proline-rich protein [Lactarius pseudohatsudake]|nr:proline-rich protein [Lactarius pseudohatsudake]
MPPSLEDDATSNTTGAAAQSPEPQPHSNHHSPSSPNPEVRSKRAPPRKGSVDKDAQDLVISSLRTQVQDLVSQVTQLNNKLVKSYDRVSNLEDDLHVTSSSLRTSSVKISQLELERSQHLSALDTGLLVEKSHVTSELTRLMEKATEEAARRGQAESAQAAIEKDLDDVSAALFNQANTMVAEARLGRARSERKAEDAERSLQEAEDAVRLMQQQLQSLQGEKEAAERSMDSMTTAMGKGKWIEQTPSPQTNEHLLLTSHVPYHEFLSFISHLRALRATYPQPPNIHSLLALPFVARLQLEDTDPTVRLDMTSALNWLSRRLIIAAIQSGQLTIEPISTPIILASAASPQPPLAVNVVHGSNGSNLLSCGLCGHGIVPHTEQLTPTRTGYLSRANGTNFNTWSSSIFKKSSISVPVSPSAPPSPPPYHDASSLPAQIYIFRLSEPASGFPSALPLCTSGWCLARLRSTCTLWSFLRTNVLEKIWEEEVQPLPAPPPHREVASANVDKPPVPPRRRTKPGGFWGVASSFGLDRVPGWTESDKDQKAEPETEKRRFVAPPRRVASPQPISLTPPPLPSRNRSRPRTPAVEEDAAGRRASSGTTSSSRDSQSPSSHRQGTPDSTKPEKSPTLSKVAPVQEEAPNAEDVVVHHDPSPASAVQLPGPPSRTGSPAPPPVPRRAARRAVPPPPPAARTASPAPAPEVSPAKVAEPNGHVKPETRTDPDTKANAPNSPEPDSPPKEERIEVAGPPTEAAESTSPKAEVLADAEPDKTAIRSETEEKHQPQPGEDHSTAAHRDGADLERTSTPQSPSDETDLEMIRKAAEEKAAEKARHPPPPPPRHPRPVRPTSAQSYSPEKSTHPPGKFDKPEEPAFAPDGTPYVGDGTWEERTWKELTRLREDAFWARVGRAQ